MTSDRTNGRVPCPALSSPFDHGRDHHGERKWSIKRVPVVRYCDQQHIRPLINSPLFFEWADFDANLEHIASTDLLQSVILEQPLTT